MDGDDCGAGVMGMQFPSLLAGSFTRKKESPPFGGLSFSLENTLA